MNASQWRVKRISQASLVALAIITTALGAAAAPGLVVKGDAKAWAEIEAAMVKFSRLKSYRAKGTLPGGGAMTMDAVNPDRFRIKMEMGGTTYESILVGREMRFRQGNGPWMCTGQQAAIPNMNPEKITGEVTAAKGPPATIEGVQTQSYTYSWKSAAFTSHFRLFVAVGNGLPKRMEILDDKGAVHQTLDYYDYDAPVTVTLPACG